MFGRFVDTRVFDGGNPDFGLRVERPREMVHDGVVRLGCAAGPDDVGGMAAEEGREFFTRLAQRDVRALADAMRAGRIAGDGFRRVEPGVARLADDRRGGVMVEINHANKIQLPGALASFY